MVPALPRRLPWLLVVSVAASCAEADPGIVPRDAGTPLDAQAASDAGAAGDGSVSSDAGQACEGRTALEGTWTYPCTFVGSIMGTSYYFESTYDFRGDQMDGEAILATSSDCSAIDEREALAGPFEIDGSSPMGTDIFHLHFIGDPQDSSDDRYTLFRILGGSELEVGEGSSESPETRPSQLSEVRLARTRGEPCAGMDWRPVQASVRPAASQALQTDQLPIQFELELDRPIRAESLSADDFFSQGEAWITGLTIENSGDDQRFRLEVQGTLGPGTVVPTLRQGTIFGRDGSGNFESTSSAEVVTFHDNPKPLIADAAVLATNTLPVSFTVDFGIAIDVSTFSGADVIQQGTSTDVVWEVENTGDDRSFFVRATSASDGTLLPSLPQGAVRGVTGLESEASTGPVRGVTLDRAPPSLRITRLDSTYSETSILPIRFLVEMSESCCFRGDTHVVNAGTATGVVFGGITSTDFYVYDVRGQGGTIAPTVPAGAFTDSAGNPNLASVDAYDPILFDSRTLLVQAYESEYPRTLTVPVRLGDVNCDGAADFALAKPRFKAGGLGSAGKVTVYSGQDFSVLYSISGTHERDELGTAVADIGDVDGDGCADFALSAAESWNFALRGKVLLVSGQSGNTLLTIEGPLDSNGGYGSGFGYTLAGGHDFDGDGELDFAVGDWSYEPGGKIYVYSGTTGGLPVWELSQGVQSLGFSLSFVPDLDGDGGAELLHSDRSQFFLHEVSGLVQTPLEAEGAGASGSYPKVDWLEDYDGDGQPDYLVLGQSGLHVFSGATHQRLGPGPTLSGTTMTGPDIRGNQGVYGTPEHARSAGDFDGDGRSDLLVIANASSSPLEWPDLFVFSGLDDRVLFYRRDVELATWAGDVNGDGKDDLLVFPKDPAAALVIGGHDGPL